MPSNHVLANREANSRHTYDVTIWLSRTTDNSNIFIRSREVRDSESRLYIENFKNLLVRNHWTDFNIILQECLFGDPVPRLFKPSGFVKKHGCQGAELIFPTCIYLYGKLLKASCQKHWADFNIILQKRSFSNPLPRLFKPFGFLKKHGHQRAGLIFPIYLYRKVWKSSCQKPLDRFQYNTAGMFLL